MNANTQARGDETFVLKYNGTPLIEADSREELIERANELQGKALLFYNGDFAEPFDTVEDAKSFASQRSYDLHMPSFWSIVVDGEVVYGNPPGDHPHGDWGEGA
jgi:hypothetical protein